MPDTLVYLANSGTEAVESAIKLALYKTGRTKFIGFIGGFPRAHIGFPLLHRQQSGAAGQLPTGRQRAPHALPQPLPPHSGRRPGETYGETVIRYLEEQILHNILDPNDIAGILIEPIQGEGGYVVPSPGFFPRLREICDEYGIMLIVDEIQSGAGRTGKWWAIEHEEVEPDIVCFAKGGGQQHAHRRHHRPPRTYDLGPGSHGSTFGGNPVAAMSAIATLNVIEEEGLLNQAQTTGAYIMQRLHAMQKQYPMIGDIRGRGLMIGMEFVKDPDTKERAVEVRIASFKTPLKRGCCSSPAAAMASASRRPSTSRAPG
ncbi:MAG: aminotransferase class III-fold pyridoxal phosphate-dependent enzyme [Chloroflexi bacterium]|nr:aminotransferase class III-fold pyridoxal phosphate-dependent enzyme [Chloroflexota bacterium]